MGVMEVRVVYYFRGKEIDMGYRKGKYRGVSYTVSIDNVV